MKKAAGIIAKSLLGLVLLVLILLFTIPVIFKDKIKSKVEQVINQSVNANVRFADYSLGFFHNFPNLSFGMKDVSVVGVGKFAGDTLAGFKSFDLVFNLSSLFGKSGYEVKSILIDRGVVNVIYLKDGSANYDIMKPSVDTAAAVTDTTSSGLKILLKQVTVRNSTVSYVDKGYAMEAYLNKLNFDLKGDMTMSQTDLQISLNSGDVTFLMDGIKYINKAVVDSKIDMLANLDKWIFTFRDNYILLNDLKLIFTGTVEMPFDDITTDLKFSTEKASFKSLLSLIPSVYMADFKDLKASGEFTLNGSAKGVYSDADSTMPDVSLSIDVRNGIVSYPALPEKIQNINIRSDIYMDGKDMDRTTVNVDRFHFDLAGNPFDMTFAIKTPMSDPDFSGSMIGKIDLAALIKAVPLDSINLSGLIDMSVKMAGRYSMIEKEQYDKFQASGSMNIKNMLVAMIGYPEVKINEAAFDFSPAYAAMSKADINVGGKSDFNIAGRLENYIPYFLKNETIKGSLTLKSNMVDVSDILSKMVSDTTAVEDTTSLAIIAIPKNIDFDFNAAINSLIYDKIKAHNIQGHILIHHGILSFRDASMNILGGLISMNADYDTRDTLKPVMKADFNVQSLGVKDAFTTFNTIQKLAPAAKGIDGKINLQLSYQSLLGSNMMPVIKTIAGGGKLQSDEITLVESIAYNKMKDVLKLSDKYSNTFKNINVSFKISDGRVYVSPFDTKVGNIKMNVSGDQGLDQTLNYLVKTEIPRSDLGNSVNSLIDNLSAQASAFGIAFKPADVLKVNVRITGVFGKPVVMPDFGSKTGESTSGLKETAKETVKQTIDNSVEKGKDKLRQESETQGDKLVSEAELRGQQLRDQADSAAVKIRKEADIQAQKLIDSAASKGTIAKMAAQKGADALKKEAEKKAVRLTTEADIQATKLVEEAKTKKQELINKI
jgi:hypothetical protein